MTKQFILAHDLGTTGDKASLYDSSGQALSSVFTGYATHFPNPGWVEQNPEDWWQAVCVSTRKLLASARVPRQEIACVVFSGQMMGCIPLDRQARPLRSAIIWADSRATVQAARLIEALGLENAYRITGHRVSPNYGSPKMAWMREHQPELFAQVHKFVLAKDFIAARLTGNFVSDFTDAASLNLMDLRTWNWSPAILEALQLDPALLPELHASTDVVGEVLPGVSEETGLAAGTPVVIGGGDGLCATVGAGVVRPGSAYTYIGSSTWIAITTLAPLFDPGMRTFTWPHMLPGMYSPTGTMQTGGGAYQWVRDALCPQELETARRLELSPYELMNLEAEKSPPGARGLLFLPYLLGERSPRWNPKARGSLPGPEHAAQPGGYAARHAGRGGIQYARHPGSLPGPGGADRHDAHDRRGGQRPAVAADPGGYLPAARAAPRPAGGGHLAGSGNCRRDRRGAVQGLQHRRDAHPHPGQAGTRSEPAAAL